MGKQRTVEGINERLKLAAIPVRVRQKGSALYLRAQVPAMPGRVGKQRLEWALKRSPSQDGLKYAEAEAMRLGSQLALGRFDWKEWGPERGQKQTIGAQIERFQKFYLASHDISQDTWDRHWGKALGKLPQDGDLEPSAFIDAALLSPPNTQIRRQTVQQLQRFANWAKVDVDLSLYKGSYGDHQRARRELPSDEEIVKWRDAITSPEWQWFYGMMAAYGLRPYEPWFCTFESDQQTLFVTVGKKSSKKTTPQRYVKPLYPDWAKRWDLADIKRPILNCPLPRNYSQRCCNAFVRYGIPFPPKTLRHCYAVRAAIVFRLSQDTAADFMGHDVIIHARTYKRWLTKVQKDWEYERVINDPGLPEAP